MNRIISAALLPVLLISSGIFISHDLGLPSKAYADTTSQALVLNEISPWSSDGIVRIELMNADSESCALSGWSLSFFSGGSVILPANGPDCPVGGLVLVSIGPGAANPVLEGNCVKIHIPVIAGINPGGDGCLLSGPSGPSDAITWLEPPVGSGISIPAGPPLKPVFETIHEGDQLIRPDDVLIRLPNTYAPGTENYIGSQNWVFGLAEDASLGEHNPFPPAAGYKPADGARIASDFNLTVMGLDWAVEANFQVSDDETFSSLVIDETVPEHYLPVTDLPAGTYFWRVQCIDQSGTPAGWSAVRRFIVEPFDIDELIGNAVSQSGSMVSGHETRLAANKSGGPDGLELAGSEVLESWHVVGCSHIQQRKDTEMVCLDGCPMSGGFPWDGAHPTGSNMGGGHKGWYCSRACIAMIAGLGGCTLSQDRVTYYIFEEAGSGSHAASGTGSIDEPEGDLGHDTGIDDHDICMCLNWLYRSSGAVSRTYSASIFDDGDPSDMDSVKEFIDDGRPVIRDIQRRTDTHSTLIDGYAVVRMGTDVTNYVHVLDPWSPNDVEWEAFGFDDTRYIEFPPTSGSPNRCDEATIGRDSDGDGLVDFDEVNRFETDPNHDDSDGDGLTDRLDVLGYVFNPDGTHNLRDADIDGDGQRKERDPDNDTVDDSAVNDGCEDYNLDGFYTTDGRETDCFDSSDDGNVTNPFCTAGFITIDSEVSIPAFPGCNMRIHEEMSIEPGAQILSNDMIHDFYWKLESDTMSIPMVGMSIISYAEGDGEGRASLRLVIGEGGHYTMITDCEPRVVTYQIVTVGGGMDRVTTQDFHLALGDHHYDYVSSEAPPMVFQMLEAYGPVNHYAGVIERDDTGIRFARGLDVFDIPSSLTGLSGAVTREWEIRLDRLPSR